MNEIKIIKNLRRRDVTLKLYQILKIKFPHITKYNRIKMRVTI